MCRSISAPTFYPLHGHKTPPGEGIDGSPQFSEVSAMSQIGKAPRRLLSASVDSHFPPTQNNPCTEWRILGGHILIPHSIFRTWFPLSQLCFLRGGPSPQTGPLPTAQWLPQPTAGQTAPGLHSHPLHHTSFCVEELRLYSKGRNFGVEIINQLHVCFCIPVLEYLYSVV